MNILKHKRGISIIEALVAMTIFITVVTVAVGGFVAIVRLQRKSLIMRETQQNARIALEIISRDARQSRSANATNGGNNLSLTMANGTTVNYTLAGRRLTRNGIPVTTSNNIQVARTGGFPVFEKGGALLTIRFSVTNDVGVGVYDQDNTSVETTIILEGAING